MQDQIGAVLCVMDTSNLGRCRHDDGAQNLGHEGRVHEREQRRDELRPVPEELDQDLVTRRWHGAGCKSKPRAIARHA